MTRKIEKLFVDYGCGFPVVLQNVPLINVRGVWTPDIDYNELHEKVLRKLASNQERLTGNQIKFIRHFLGLTLVEFGEHFDVGSKTVTEWETAGDDTPLMFSYVERDLKLFIMNKLSCGGEK